MRFALAAGILANTLPSNFQSNGLVEAREDRRALWRSLAVIPPSDRVAAAKEALTNRQRRMNGGMLKNFAAERVAPSKACDPDIGLLACGSGEYCDGSHDSSLGGVCVPFPEEIERVLKENVTISGPGVYCDPSSPHYGGLNCTCNDWLAQNNTGTIHCSLVADACFKGCNTTCYAIDFTYFSDGSDISYQYCYDFIRPINQSFCFGYKNDQTCLLSLDGDMCSSCNTTYRLDCTTGKCYSQPCANFDCNNIGLSTGNSCYNTVVPPAFEKCYQQLNGLYPSCSLCPTNGILYPGAEFTLPGYGLFNCSYLESFATSGALNPQQCTYAQSLANSICCEKANQSVYVCNLCGGDGYVMTKRKYKYSKLPSVLPTGSTTNHSFCLDHSRRNRVHSKSAIRKLRKPSTGS